MFSSGVFPNTPEVFLKKDGLFINNAGLFRNKAGLLFPLDCIDCPLQFFQEPGGVLAVHLGVMELEGDGQRCLQPSFAITAPDQEGAVEDAAILIGNTVELCACDC